MARNSLVKFKKGIISYYETSPYEKRTSSPYFTARSFLAMSLLIYVQIKITYWQLFDFKKRLNFAFSILMTRMFIFNRAKNYKTELISIDGKIFTRLFIIITNSSYLCIHCCIVKYLPLENSWFSSFFPGSYHDNFSILSIHLQNYLEIIVYNVEVSIFSQQFSAKKSRRTKTEKESKQKPKSSRTSFWKESNFYSSQINIVEKCAIINNNRITVNINRLQT